MNIPDSVCYRAVLARDERYDGRFFTCVKTTDIYCRPICPARPPKLENCRFVPTAAAAQAAGFRPCLRCKPESSPDLDAWRGTSATVSRLPLKLIEGGDFRWRRCDDACSTPQKIGDRQLRRLFQKHIGATPISVAQTRRVLLAKQLIHQTNLSMIEVALGSGFGSVRRFNETFQRLYNRPPSELRRRAVLISSSPEISLLLPYRPPYDWEAMLGFLATRAISGMEVVVDGSYRRVIELAGVTGSIDVSHAVKVSALRVVVRFPKLNALPTIIARIRRMFDLSAEPLAIAAALSGDEVLRPFVEMRPGLRVPGGWDTFEIAVRGVLGQQLTVRAGRTFAEKIVSAIGKKVDRSVEMPGLTHVFPGPELFSAEKLSGLGMTSARVAAIVGIAAAVVRDAHLFDPRRDLAEAVARLRDLPGIGEWTAQYIAMRALGESDAFLAGDVAIQRMLEVDGKRSTAAELLLRAESWRPWRAYAMLHLWMADSQRGQNKMMKENDYALYGLNDGKHRCRCYCCCRMKRSCFCA